MTNIEFEAPQGVACRLIMSAGSLVPDAEIAEMFSLYRYQQAGSDTTLWEGVGDDSGEVIRLRVVAGGEVIDILDDVADNYVNVNFIAMRIGWLRCYAIAANDVALQAAIRFITNVSLEGEDESLLPPPLNPLLEDEPLPPSSPNPVVPSTEPQEDWSWSASRPVMNNTLKASKQIASSTYIREATSVSYPNEVHLGCVDTVTEAIQRLTYIRDLLRLHRASLSDDEITTIRAATSALVNAFACTEIGSDFSGNTLNDKAKLILLRIENIELQRQLENSSNEARRLESVANEFKDDVVIGRTAHTIAYNAANTLLRNWIESTKTDDRYSGPVEIDGLKTAKTAVLRASFKSMRELALAPREELLSKNGIGDSTIDHIVRHYLARDMMCMATFSIKVIRNGWHGQNYLTPLAVTETNNRAYAWDIPTGIFGKTAARYRIERSGTSERALMLTPIVSAS